MFAFQLYAKKRDDEDEEERKDYILKVKAGKIKQFLKAHLPSDKLASGTDDEIVAVLSETEKMFKKGGISSFMSTLTPGAQNAIYAASFIWGYERAIKYVQNAMKLEQVKNAADQLGRSRTVVESVQSQVSDQPQKKRETTQAVWSFYNEDLKQTQAQATKTEIMTDKEMLESQSKAQLPASPEEAVAMGLESKAQNAAVIYCVQMAAEKMESEQYRIATEEKKKQLAHLEAQQPQKEQQIMQKQATEQKKAEEKAIAEKTAVEEKAIAEKTAVEEKVKQEAKQAEKAALPVEKQAIQQAQKEQQLIIVSQEEEQKIMAQARELNIPPPVVKEIIARREELIKKYEEIEKELNETIYRLSQLDEESEERVKKIVKGMLPAQLYKKLLKRKKSLFKRRAMIKLLKKWLVFCKDGKARLLKVSIGRLLKMVSLSSLSGLFK